MIAIGLPPSGGTVPLDITYCTTPAFERALKDAFLRGGTQRKKHDKVRVVLGSLEQPDPFQTLSVTNHGESRLKNCIKYELGDGWRLVTKQTEKTCVFQYVGDHEDAERWLNSHRGEDIGVKDKRFIRLPGVSLDAYSERKGIVDQHDAALLDLLESDDDKDHLLDDLKGNYCAKDLSSQRWFNLLRG